MHKDYLHNIIAYQSRYDITEGRQGEVDLSGLLEALTLSQ